MHLVGFYFKNTYTHTHTHTHTYIYIYIYIYRKISSSIGNDMEAAEILRLSYCKKYHKTYTVTGDTSFA